MRYAGIAGLLVGLVAAQNTNVGIGTATPTHRLHIATGTLRVEALSGTGTVLAQTGAVGVLGRFAAASSATQLLQGNAVWGSDATDWKLLGNAGTNPTLHFVGTTDATDFRLGVNSTTRWRILSTGEHWVGGNTTATLNNAQVSVDAPAGWIAVYGQVTGGQRPAIRGTVGDNSSGPAVGAVNTASDGWGAIGIGSGSTIGNLPNDGGGAYGVSTEAGVVGSYTGADGSSRAGGAFAVRDAGGNYDWVYVAGYEGGNQRKIWGVGTASTTVQSYGKYHTLFCPEAPEVLLWDAGRFWLQAQRQWVPLDSLLALHLAPPYMVWLQPWGDLSLRVVEVSSQGFWVEADQLPTHPIEVSFLVQARRLGPPSSPFHLERLPAVEPSRFFTPFRPVTQYLTPGQLK
ncbi:MAG: hypothetical protein KatS3mg026_1222 [Bacteroidia bacterium]|nr:MAG: hypothetical protein KatS3mg026_1222 [Bacteroidia bacterium]